MSVEAWLGKSCLGRGPPARVHHARKAPCLGEAYLCPNELGPACPFIGLCAACRRAGHAKQEACEVPAASGACFRFVGLPPACGGLTAALHAQGLGFPPVRGWVGPGTPQKPLWIFLFLPWSR